MEETAQLTAQLEAAQSRIRELEEATRELNAVREALRESEALYRTAFEYTGTAMMVVEEDTTISMGNHRMQEITGYAEEEIAAKKKWTEVVETEDRDRMLDYHRRRRVEGRAPTEYEFRLRHKGGALRDMLVNVSMVPGTRRSLISLIDITDRKRADRALRESERRYRDLIENANDIIYTHDFSGNFTSANKAALRTYGYTADEIAKLNIRDIVDPSCVQTVLDHMTEKFSNLEPIHRYELLTRTRAGEPVWVEVSSRIICEDGKAVGIQGIARDVTERKQRDSELEESRRRFKEIADLLPGIICEMDASMKLTYVNRMGLHTFGFTHEDFERGINVLELVPAAEKEKLAHDMYNITHGDYGNPVQYRLLRKDDSPIDVIINSAPVRSDGELAGIRTCMIDVSDRVVAQRKLKESEERFRSVFEHSPIGIALFSPEGRNVDMNDSFRDMMGSGGGDIQPDVLLESLVELGTDSHDRLAAGEGLVLEAERDCGGQARYLEWHFTALGLSGAEASKVLLAQVQDITESKRAQIEQLEKERAATAKAEALVAGLKRELKEKATFHNMVSRSPQMKHIFDILPEVAGATATVLISGESGTGKELIARSLHEMSPRKGKPFVAINCSALPDNLLESELFGYKAGAFTDAKKDKPGKFAMAENGTIFLDEIGDISAAMQVKLLRVIQERVYEPLGGTTPVKANVRILAATNKDLASMVKSGDFREDLFYRINVVTIKLPPLRDRRCDIPILCEHFIERFNDRYEKRLSRISQEVMSILLAHEFPGNIRELENVMEHAFIFCKEDPIELRHLPSEFQDANKVQDARVLAKVKNFDELEKMYIRSVLDETGGSKIKAAQRLGIHKATLFRKLKQLGIQ